MSEYVIPHSPRNVVHYPSVCPRNCFVFVVFLRKVCQTAAFANMFCFHGLFNGLNEQCKVELGKGVIPYTCGMAFFSSCNHDGSKHVNVFLKTV